MFYITIGALKKVPLTMQFLAETPRLERRSLQIEGHPSSVWSGDANSWQALIFLSPKTDQLVGIGNGMIGMIQVVLIQPEFAGPTRRWCRAFVVAAQAENWSGVLSLENPWDWYVYVPKIDPIDAIDFKADLSHSYREKIFHRPMDPKRELKPG